MLGGCCLYRHPPSLEVPMPPSPTTPSPCPPSPTERPAAASTGRPLRSAARSRRPFRAGGLPRPTRSRRSALSCLREPALAQEFFPVFVCSRDDLLAGGSNAVDEGGRRGVGIAGERRGGLMREARRGVFRVPDVDLLEVLDAPEVAVLADCAQVKAGDAQGFGPDLRIPAVEPPEIQVGRAIEQDPCLDRAQIVDQEEEDVTVRGVERRRVLGDIDLRIVDAGRPIEQSTNRARRAPSTACTPVPLPPMRGTAETSS